MAIPGPPCWIRQGSLEKQNQVKMTDRAIDRSSKKERERERGEEMYGKNWLTHR